MSAKNTGGIAEEGEYTRLANEREREREREREGVGCVGLAEGRQRTN